MKKNQFLEKLIFGFILLFLQGQLIAQGSFRIADIKSSPFPEELSASAQTNRIAWVFNEQGRRNIYIAEGPDFNPIKLTNYTQDDGQELTSVSLSADGKWVVYLRGGEHGSNWDDEVTMNPLSMPEPPKVQMWSIPFEGGTPILLGEGANPTISPKSDKVAFVKGGQIWTAPIHESEKGEKLFTQRGSNGSPVWSPDGSKIAFVSQRSGHSFIGIYQGPDKRITWATPDFDRDYSPRWSPDGKAIAFIRTPGKGGAPNSIVENHHSPWKIMTYYLDSGETKIMWEAPETLRGSVPRTHGGTNLHWAKGHIIFLSYHDGWPHLYAIKNTGGEAKLLTKGDFMAEHITLSPNKSTVLFTANTGNNPYDIDRRHIVKVEVESGKMEVITPGTGLEWSPLMLSDNKTVACISATPEAPPLPSIVIEGKVKRLAEDLIPDNFPEQKLVTPKQVKFQSEDGLTIHASLFEREDIKGKKPAVIYIHGGPPRQMLLGWHYSSYYSNAYALNQYLANQGFVVLSVNYRLGIGYGYEFHNPPNSNTKGASEYKDIVAAGEWLAEQDQVDKDKIGVYGGSYGGYLTAMALGRDSRLFAAGVDIHGVHDRTNQVRNILMPNSYERAPDAQYATEVAWKSSPIAYVDGWTSPVLIIHGDDDRNVNFDQSTDLVQRLRAKKVDTETLIIVDDSHHFMLHENQMKVNEATAEFLIRQLKK